MLWSWTEAWCVRDTLHVKLTYTGPLTCRPELLHPFASAIDEPELKVPVEMVRFYD
jgi:hypothetical protein